MADITAFSDGSVNDSGKVNWRGDQATTPIGQSVYKSSSVKLATLGARVVVGDRVFRYSRAGGTVVPGDVVGKAGVAVDGIDTPAATTPTPGQQGDKYFAYYSTLARAADFYADGVLVQQTGTDGNAGQQYGIKTHAALLATTVGQYLTLYDPLVASASTSGNTWFAVENPYSRVVAASGGIQYPMGVAAVGCASGEYLWLQTWGPAPVRAAVCTAVGVSLTVGVTGAVGAYISTASAGTPLNAVIGYSMQIMTASTKGLVFVQIAP